MRVYLLFLVCLFAYPAVVSASTDEYKSKLHIESEATYETEYVHRGRKLGQRIFATSTAVSHPLAEGDLYVGLKTRLETESAHTSGNTIQRLFQEQFEASFNAIVPYVRYERKLSDKFTATLGYFHYYYPKMDQLDSSFRRVSHNMIKPGLKSHANEVMFGIWADVIFRPTLFMFYNFDFDEFVATGHLFAKYGLEKIGLPKAYLLANTYLGFDHANRPYGITFHNPFWYKNPQWGTINGKKGYIYGGAKLHLVYDFNEYSRIKTGINFEANGNNGMSWTNFTGWASHKGVKKMIWYSLSAEFRF